MNTKHGQRNSIRRRTGRQIRKQRKGFLLILVLLVVSIATLAALNFSRSMLISRETAMISNGRLQARMAAESGAQSVRLFLAYPRLTRTEMGGTWSNDMFYARNVIPDVDPKRRANFTIVSPALDELGNFTGFRFGLQNESAKLNLNTLAQLDALASSGDLGAAAVGDLGGAAGAVAGELASAATETVATSLATNLLLALPGMTEEISDAILDYLDEDEEPRPLGAEFSDYYQLLQPAYKPKNGPLDSIEQLLQVRGVTPALLFGYDENRNGVLDQAELSKLNSGIQPGLMPGQIAVADPNAVPPPPLGWAPYLTLHSLEKNVASDGSERININGDDLQLLYDDLVAVLNNELWASFIVAYRVSGQSGNGGTSPLMKLASMSAADANPDGALGTQLDGLAAVPTPQGGDGGTPVPWDSSALAQFDLTQAGAVKFTQVLDLIDATVTLQQGNTTVTYSSPFTSFPLDMANSNPVLMDLLTTVDAPAVPGRINIMECPREILAGIPGLTDEIVEEIIAARNDGSDSESRKYETWLMIEGYVTMDEMRAILPLVTCGGDVFKAQIIGYLEGESAFSRIEAIVSGAGEVPEILFFRKMDHLSRGFDIATLGQRFDAGMSGMGTTIPGTAGAMGGMQ
ncbi:MAG: type II secretion system protein GspK [Pirellulaceae bacterium]